MIVVFLLRFMKLHIVMCLLALLQKVRCCLWWNWPLRQ